MLLVSLSLSFLTGAPFFFLSMSLLQNGPMTAVGFCSVTLKEVEGGVGGPGAKTDVNLKLDFLPMASWLLDTFICFPPRRTLSDGCLLLEACVFVFLCY